MDMDMDMDTGVYSDTNRDTDMDLDMDISCGHENTTWTNAAKYSIGGINTFLLAAVNEFVINYITVQDDCGIMLILNLSSYFWASTVLTE